MASTSGSTPSTAVDTPASAKFTLSSGLDNYTKLQKDLKTAKAALDQKQTKQQIIYRSDMVYTNPDVSTEEEKISRLTKQITPLTTQILKSFAEIKPTTLETLRKHQIDKLNLESLASLHEILTNALTTERTKSTPDQKEIQRLQHLAGNVAYLCATHDPAPTPAQTPTSDSFVWLQKAFESENFDAANELLTAWSNPESSLRTAIKSVKEVSDDAVAQFYIKIYSLLSDILYKAALDAIVLELAPKLNPPLSRDAIFPVGVGKFRDSLDADEKRMRDFLRVVEAKEEKEDEQATALGNLVAGFAQLTKPFFKTRVVKREIKIDNAVIPAFLQKLNKSKLTFLEKQTLADALSEIVNKQFVSITGAALGADPKIACRGTITTWLQDQFNEASAGLIKQLELKLGTETKDIFSAEARAAVSNWGSWFSRSKTRAELAIDNFNNAIGECEKIFGSATEFSIQARKLLSGRFDTWVLAQLNTELATHDKEFEFKESSGIPFSKYKENFDTLYRDIEKYFDQSFSGESFVGLRSKVIVALNEKKATWLNPLQTREKDRLLKDFTDGFASIQKDPTTTSVLQRRESAEKLSSGIVYQGRSLDADQKKLLEDGINDAIRKWLVLQQVEEANRLCIDLTKKLSLITIEIGTFGGIKGAYQDAKAKAEEFSEAQCKLSHQIFSEETYKETYPVDLEGRLREATKQWMTETLNSQKSLYVTNLARLAEDKRLFTEKKKTFDYLISSINSAVDVFLIAPEEKKAEEKKAEEKKPAEVEIAKWNMPRTAWILQQQERDLQKLTKSNDPFPMKMQQFKLLVDALDQSIEKFTLDPSTALGELKQKRTTWLEAQKTFEIDRLNRTLTEELTKIWESKEELPLTFIQKRTLAQKCFDDKVAECKTSFPAEVPPKGDLKKTPEEEQLTAVFTNKLVKPHQEEMARVLSIFQPQLDAIVNPQGLRELTGSIFLQMRLRAESLSAETLRPYEQLDPTLKESLDAVLKARIISAFAGKKTEDAVNDIKHDFSSLELGDIPTEGNTFVYIKGEADRHHQKVFTRSKEIFTGTLSYPENLESELKTVKTDWLKQYQNDEIKKHKEQLGSLSAAKDQRSFLDKKDDFDREIAQIDRDAESFDEKEQKAILLDLRTVRTRWITDQQKRDLATLASSAMPFSEKMANYRKLIVAFNQSTTGFTWVPSDAETQLQNARIDWLKNALGAELDRIVDGKPQSPQRSPQRSPKQGVAESKTKPTFVQIKERAQECLRIQFAACEEIFPKGAVLEGAQKQLKDTITTHIEQPKNDEKDRLLKLLKDRLDGLETKADEKFSEKPFPDQKKAAEKVYEEVFEQSKASFARLDPPFSIETELKGEKEKRFKQYQTSAIQRYQSDLTDLAASLDDFKTKMTAIRERSQKFIREVDELKGELKEFLKTKVTGLLEAQHILDVRSADSQQRFFEKKKVLDESAIALKASSEGFGLEQQDMKPCLDGLQSKRDQKLAEYWQDEEKSLTDKLKGMLGLIPDPKKSFVEITAEAKRGLDALIHECGFSFTGGEQKDSCPGTTEAALKNWEEGWLEEQRLSALSALPNNLNAELAALVKPETPYSQKQAEAEKIKARYNAENQALRGKVEISGIIDRWLASQQQNEPDRLMSQLSADLKQFEPYDSTKNMAALAHRFAQITADCASNITDEKNKQSVPVQLRQKVTMWLRTQLDESLTQQTTKSERELANDQKQLSEKFSSKLDKDEFNGGNKARLIKLFQHHLQHGFVDLCVAESEDKHQNPADIAKALNMELPEFASDLQDQFTDRQRKLDILQLQHGHIQSALELDSPESIFPKPQDELEFESDLQGDTTEVKQLTSLNAKLKSPQNYFKLACIMESIAVAKLQKSQYSLWYLLAVNAPTAELQAAYLDTINGHWNEIVGIKKLTQEVSLKDKGVPTGVFGRTLVGIDAAIARQDIQGLMGKLEFKFEFKGLDLSEAKNARAKIITDLGINADDPQGDRFVDLHIKAVVDTAVTGSIVKFHKAYGDSNVVPKIVLPRIFTQLAATLPESRPSALQAFYDDLQTYVKDGNTAESRFTDAQSFQAYAQSRFSQLMDQAVAKSSKDIYEKVVHDADTGLTELKLVDGEEKVKNAAQVFVQQLTVLNARKLCADFENPAPGQKLPEGKEIKVFDNETKKYCSEEYFPGLHREFLEKCVIRSVVESAKQASNAIPQDSPKISPQEIVLQWTREAVSVSSRLEYPVQEFNLFLSTQMTAAAQNAISTKKTHVENARAKIQTDLKDPLLGAQKSFPGLGFTSQSFKVSGEKQQAILDIFAPNLHIVTGDKGYDDNVLRASNIDSVNVYINTLIYRAINEWVRTINDQYQPPQVAQIILARTLTPESLNDFYLALQKKLDGGIDQATVSELFSSNMAEVIKTRKKKAVTQVAESYNKALDAKDVKDVKQNITDAAKAFVGQLKPEEARLLCADLGFLGPVPAPQPAAGAAQPAAAAAAAPAAPELKQAASVRVDDDQKLLQQWVVVTAVESARKAVDSAVSAAQPAGAAAAASPAAPEQKAADTVTPEQILMQWQGNSFPAPKAAVGLAEQAAAAAVVAAPAESLRQSLVAQFKGTFQAIAKFKDSYDYRGFEELQGETKGYVKQVARGFIDKMKFADAKQLCVELGCPIGSAVEAKHPDATVNDVGVKFPEHLTDWVAVQAAAAAQNASGGFTKEQILLAWNGIEVMNQAYIESPQQKIRDKVYKRLLLNQIMPVKTKLSASQDAWKQFSAPYVSEKLQTQGAAMFDSDRDDPERSSSISSVYTWNCLAQAALGLTGIGLFVLAYSYAVTKPKEEQQANVARNETQALWVSAGQWMMTQLKSEYYSRSSGPVSHEADVKVSRSQIKDQVATEATGDKALPQDIRERPLFKILSDDAKHSVNDFKQDTKSPESLFRLTERVTKLCDQCLADAKSQRVTEEQRGNNAVHFIEMLGDKGDKHSYLGANRFAQLIIVALNSNLDNRQEVVGNLFNSFDDQQLNEVCYQLYQNSKPMIEANRQKLLADILPILHLHQGEFNSLGRNAIIGMDPSYVSDRHVPRYSNNAAFFNSIAIGYHVGQDYKIAAEIEKDIKDFFEEEKKLQPAVAPSASVDKSVVKAAGDGRSVVVSTTSHAGIQQAIASRDVKQQPLQPQPPLREVISKFSDGALAEFFVAFERKLSEHKDEGHKQRLCQKMFTQLIESKKLRSLPLEYLSSFLANIPQPQWQKEVSEFGQAEVKKHIDNHTLDSLSYDQLSLLRRMVSSQGAQGDKLAPMTQAEIHLEMAMWKKTCQNVRWIAQACDHAKTQQAAVVASRAADLDLDPILYARTQHF